MKIRTRIVHLALLAGTAFSVSAAVQFDASFAPSLTARDGTVAAWSSTAGGAILAPCHGASNGWAAATLTAEGLCFGETAAGVPSPFAFYPARTALVSHVLLVADCDGSRPMSTLLDASAAIRIAPVHFPDDTPHLESSVAAGASGIWIDGDDPVGLPQGLHLFDVALSNPCPMGDLYLGGSPATPAWRRSWDGAIREAIFLAPGETGQRNLAAARAYLSRKWGLPPLSSGMADEYAVITRLGLRAGNLYGSLLMVR